MLQLKIFGTLFLGFITSCILFAMYWGESVLHGGAEAKFTSLGFFVAFPSSVFFVSMIYGKIFDSIGARKRASVR